MGTLKAKVGGSWVPIAAGGSEVFVGTSDPGFNYALWYDTDAVAADLIPVSYPRGYVGSTMLASTYALPTTGWTDAPGMGITFTPSAANRWFRMTFSGSLQVSSATPVVLAGISDGSTQVAIQEIYTSSTGYTMPFCVVYPRLLTSAAAVTFKPQVYSNGGVVNLMTGGARNARFLIEDIGGT